MNPQLRLFHEYVWEALENAGYNPYTYKGLIGLYAGSATSFNWEALTYVTGKGEDMGEFAAGTLSDKDFLCSRVSYKLQLKGPSTSIHTACSTSLVAIHQACRALLTGECTIALAGGATVLNQQKTGYLYHEGMVLSSDGHCRAFDAEADGTVAGSGVGVVALKLLKHAIADRDHIHAVIKGSAINNDGGRKVGFAAPSVDGQSEVIRMAMRMARVEPESIGYIETHGTGTKLGDMIEISALKTAYHTDKRNYCAVGSVKTNIGHLDAAAGVAGFIKTVLALKHQSIPPSLNYVKPNPQIDFQHSPFFVNQESRPWKIEGYPLRAGVSSFGIGGTNAHLILEEAPARELTERKERWNILLLSARTAKALEEHSKNIANHFLESEDIHIADAAYSLQLGRHSFEHRKFLVSSNTRDAADSLLSDQVGAAV